MELLTSPKEFFNYVDASITLKRSSYNKNTDGFVSDIMDGNFFFFNNFDLVRFDNGIDWDYKHHHNANTYQMYMHSLEIVGVLCNYYEEKKDKSALSKAYDILKEWLSYSSKDKPLSKYCWYDHTVANRSLNIVYFLCLAKDNVEVDEKPIFESLVKHGEIMYKDEGYSLNNHGIMVDRSLIQLSLFLKSPKTTSWREKGLSRVKSAFYRDFSAKGVHLENSPEYHRIVKGIYFGIEKYLKTHNLTLGDDIVDKIALSNQYFKHLVKPNMELPLIGDSEKISVDIKKNFNSFIDTQAGIGILQYRRGADEGKSTWLSFVCGYGNLSHKHYDDLSINLFYNGEDIFIDSGKYSYNLSDPVRQYIISPKAHSTILIGDSLYNLDTPSKNREKIKITDFSENKYYKMIKGRNLTYDGVKVYRTVILLGFNVLIIFDDIISEESHVYKQHFNLNPKIKVQRKEEDFFNLSSNVNAIVIKERLGGALSYVNEANADVPHAVFSERFSKLNDNRQVGFMKHSKNQSFLTTVEMGQSNFKYVKYDTNSRILEVDYNNERLSIVL